MVTTTRSTSGNRARSQSRTGTGALAAVRRRRSQRGASVLIVFLVLAMLTGIGMFAARAATLSTAVSGSSKQLMQTRYITEYAILNATAALAANPQRYIDQMPLYTPVLNDPKCYGMASTPNATCYPLGIGELQQLAGVPLIIPADLSNNVPGGLGRNEVEADFNIDLTDLQPASPPVPGEALNAENPVKTTYLSVTLTAIGQLRRKPKDAADVAQSLASSSSVQTWRAHVVVGPLASPAARPPAP